MRQTSTCAIQFLGKLCSEMNTQLIITVFQRSCLTETKVKELLQCVWAGKQRFTSLLCCRYSQCKQVKLTSWAREDDLNRLFGTTHQAALENHRDPLETEL